MWLRSVLTLAVLLLAFELLTAAFSLMNQPSDESLVLGVGMILALTVAVPLAVLKIWSRQR